MRRVITYGTFDLLHYGHIALLRRAKELGDYLIVALSTDEFNWNKIAQDTHFIYQKAICETIAEKQRKELEQEKAGKVKKSKNEITKLIPFNRKNQAYA